jgi:mono/diheme cytochrome c family protein
MTGLIGSRCRTTQQRGWDMRRVLFAAMATAVLCAAGFTWPASARPPIRTEKQPAVQPTPPAVATPADIPPASPAAEMPAGSTDSTAASPPALAQEPAPTTITAPAAPAPSIAPPEDPRFAQVFAVFDANCAQCHQTGKLTQPGPSGALASILDLPQLARQSHLVRPGQPDASLLYQVLLDRHRPLELASDLKWPGADDIARVRTWIAELPAQTAACTQKMPITTDDIAAVVDAAVTAAGEAAARELRFITLAHLANACATPAEMEGYRQAITKVLNSLSWGAQPVAPIALDEAKTVLSFKLSDIGWVEEHWNALARAEPKAIATDLAAKLKAPAANARPIRGDWLAYAATRPPFYAELLGLPPTLDETARLLGINRSKDSADGRGMRAGLRASTITRGPRVVERHQADTRRFWLAHDFADGLGEHDIFERPLGGVRGAPEKGQFRDDGQRLIFSLPNGFFAFALYESDGHRIDQLPQRLELDPSRSAGATLAAQSCLSCHTAGLKPFTDQMRSHLGSDKFVGPREVKDHALTLYDTQNDWVRVLDEDGYRYRRAMIQAGIDPDLTIGGIELTTALGNRYTRNVDLKLAAAELGVLPDALDARLADTAFASRSLGHRLRQGLLSRTDANRLLLALNVPPATTPDPKSQTIAPAGASIALALWTGQTVYKTGELLTVYAQPSAACYLTLISVNAAGKATVLFPSEFDPDNLVRPDAPFALPGDKAHYQFRLKDPGTETVVARCQTQAKFPAGVEPDYERQRFTVLGSYDNFLRTSYSLDTDAARQRAAAKAPAKDAKPAAGQQSESTARAAVSITIK